MSELLFIYGTLHPDRAPADIASTASLLQPLGEPPANRATIQGRLYDLGEYPGVHLTDSPSDTVSGELFSLPEGPECDTVLARLDAYEDFRPLDPAKSLFLRLRTVATLEDGTLRDCWVYTYTGLQPDLQPASTHNR